MESRADITAPKHVGLRKGTTVPTQAESKVNVSRSWHDELLASEDEPGANMPGTNSGEPTLAMPTTGKTGPNCAKCLESKLGPTPPKSERDAAASSLLQLKGERLAPVYVKVCDSSRSPTAARSGTANSSSSLPSPRIKAGTPSYAKLRKGTKAQRCRESGTRAGAPTVKTHLKREKLKLGRERAFAGRDAPKQAGSKASDKMPSQAMLRARDGSPTWERSDSDAGKPKRRRQLGGRAVPARAGL